MNVLRLLSLPPWRRAPIRLWRAAALFTSVLVAAMVLGFAAGSRTLFVSSSASAALRQDLSPGCAFDVGLRVTRTARVEGVPPADPGRFPRPMIHLGRSRRALAAATRDVAGLGEPVETLSQDAEVVGTQGAPVNATVNLVSRTHAERHIHVLEVVTTTGIWLSDTVARRVGISAGDRVGIRFDRRVVPVRVHGVFRDLTRTSRGPYWCSMERLFEETFPRTPLPVALLDQPALLAMLRRSGVPSVPVVFEYPPRAGSWSLSVARRSVAALAAISAEAGNDSTPLGKVLGQGGATVDTEGSIDHATEAAATVSASTGPVALGSAAVALLMLVIAARTWLEHRRQELVVLALRGAGSTALGIKAALEFSLPAWAGTATGIAGAYVTVRIVGPGPLIERSAISASILLAGITAAIALLAVAGIVALRVRRVGSDADGSGARRLVLWEPAALILAAAAFYELRTRGSSLVGRTKVDSLVLLFPVLLMAGAAGLLSRAALSPLLLRRGSRLPTVTWLALRRVAAERVRASAVVMGTAVSVGIVVLGASVSSSLRATVRAKVTLGPGAAQVFSVDHLVHIPHSSALQRITTYVTRTSEEVLVRGHEPADVLGLDTATFSRAAFWDRSFAGSTLPSLLRRLDQHAPDGVPAVLAVGPGLPERMTLHIDVGGKTASVRVHVVARVRAFPGYQFNTQRPLVVIDRAVLASHGVADSLELWVDSGDPGVQAQLSRLGVPVLSRLVATDRLRQTTLEPQLWALRYLQIVGFAGGVVTLSGLGLYFGAKLDRRRLGAALAGRLGLSGRAAAVTTAVEVAAMSFTGLVFGIILSRAAVQLVLRYLDPLPDAAPAILLRFDLGDVAVCAGAILVIIGATVGLVQRPASRSSLPELLRRAT